MLTTRRVILLIAVSLMTLVVLGMVVYLLDRRYNSAETVQAYEFAPVKVIPTPTTSPEASQCQQTLERHGITTENYTLGELLEKLGPPDKARSVGFYSRGGEVAFDLLYQSEQILFSTGFQHGYELRKNRLIISCDDYDPTHDDYYWPEHEHYNWQSFIENP